MKSTANNHGFTLIELIVVITIASIFGAMMYQFISTSTLKESSPLFSIEKSLKLYEVLENITSDYLENHTTDLTPLQTSIGSTEGSTQNNDYGSYRVIYNRFIKFVSNSEQNAPGGDPENGNLLKVTIESISTGERLMALYHKQ